MTKCLKYTRGPIEFNFCLFSGRSISKSRQISIFSRKQTFLQKILSRFFKFGTSIGREDNHVATAKTAVTGLGMLVATGIGK